MFQHGCLMSVQALCTKPTVRDASMASKGSGASVKDAGSVGRAGVPPAGKGVGLAAQSRVAARKGAVAPAPSAKVPGASLSKSAQKRARKKVRPSPLRPASSQCGIHTSVQRGPGITYTKISW